VCVPFIDQQQSNRLYGTSHSLVWYGRLYVEISKVDTFRETDYSFPCKSHGVAQRNVWRYYDTSKDVFISSLDTSFFLFVRHPLLIGCRIPASSWATGGRIRMLWTVGRPLQLLD